MSIVIISFTCCFLQIYDDFYGPFFNDISGGILNDYLHNIDMSVYQFRYKVDSRGEIIIYDTQDRRMSGDGGMLRNVAVSFEGEYLNFEAETSFYDWNTGTWQDGKMNLTYRHN